MSWEEDAKEFKKMKEEFGSPPENSLNKTQAFFYGFLGGLIGYMGGIITTLVV